MTQEGGQEKPCPRCGPEPAFYTPEAVAALAAQTPLAPSLAAGEPLYRERLESCRVCEALREAVLCAHCGCFVQFRARVLGNYCPHPGGDRWLSSTLYSEKANKELS